jgi:flagellar protein FliJ
VSRRFPLATVARVRRLQTGMARASVAAAHASLSVATGDVVRREQRLAAHPSSLGTLAAAAFLARADRGLRLAADVDAARAVVAEREAEVATALAAWTETRARERAVELLEDRHHARVVAEALAAEQRAADDLAGAAHRRRVVEAMSARRAGAR